MISCTIKALGQKAATLDVLTSMEIPERFKLNIPGDGMSQLCEVKKRRERGLDVVFT